MTSDELDGSESQACIDEWLQPARTMTPARRPRSRGLPPTYLILPGLGGSGEDHWQSHLERAEPSAMRFAPEDWQRPRLDDWIDALDRAVGASPNSVLVAHSLSCLLVAHWSASRGHCGIRGAFLVSVPDPQLPGFPRAAASFAGPPLERLPFPSVIISSADDPFGSHAYTRELASAWGSTVIDVGKLGHVNVASGHGLWLLGTMLLSAFTAGLP